MRLVRTESADSKGPRVDALVVAFSAWARHVRHTRPHRGGTVRPRTQSTQHRKFPPGYICTNTCDDPGHGDWSPRSANPHTYSGGHIVEFENFVVDGKCQDGGSGSVGEHLCAFGTDCTNCGPRYYSPPPSPPSTSPRADLLL